MKKLTSRADVSARTDLASDSHDAGRGGKLASDLQHALRAMSYEEGHAALSPANVAQPKGDLRHALRGMSYADGRATLSPADVAQAKGDLAGETTFDARSGGGQAFPPA